MCTGFYNYFLEHPLKSVRIYLEIDCATYLKHIQSCQRVASKVYHLVVCWKKRSYLLGTLQ